MGNNWNLLPINLKKPIGSSYTFLRNVEAHVFTQYMMFCPEKKTVMVAKKKVTFSLISLLSL